MEYQVKCEDAYEYLKSLEDKSVNLVLTDPPYIMSDGGFGGICGKRRNYHRLYAKEAKPNLRMVLTLKY